MPSDTVTSGPTWLRQRRALSLLVVLALLAGACSTPAPTTQPPATTQPAVTGQAGATPQSTTAPTPTAPPTETATPTPRVIGFVRAGGGTAGAAEAVERAAAEFGWVVEIAAGDPEADLRALAEAGARVIVADGAGLQAAVREAAGQFPETYFIGVDQAGGETPLPNLLTLGGPDSRHDQLGFAAGMVAGLLTRGRIVTAVADTGSPTGMKYRNGFLHGVRYTCTRCRVDFIDLADLNATAFAAERARLNASLSSDVVFAAAGPAGLAGLQAAAQQGAWVIGAGQDVAAEAFGGGAAAGAERLVTTVYFDAETPVYRALSAFAGGAPLSGGLAFSAENGAIGLAPYLVSEDVLIELDRNDIRAGLERLSTGLLDTGVDALTGQVR
jgi:basic membrane lipoprotein Med (substrate-binding protein (PBP1-ABC) superfamily)